VWWKIYTVFVTILFLAGIINAPGEINAGVPVEQIVFWSVFGAAMPVFVFSRLYDRDFFSRTFWKLVFVAEVLTFPFLIQFGNTLLEVDGLEITNGAMLFSVLVTFVSMLPYLVVLYIYSFTDRLTT
jgi:hypothetical protein